MKIKNETPEEISLQDEGIMSLTVILPLVGVLFLFIPSNAGASPLVMWSIGGMLILLGIIVFLLSSSYSVDITKTAIHYVRKPHMGHSRYIDQTYNSADAAYVAAKVGRRGCQTFVVFKDGNIIPLDNPNSRRSKEISIAQKVATFLGVPLQDAPSLSDVIHNPKLWG